MSNHNFKVLVVEDEGDISDHIKSIFTGIDGRVEVTIAESRNQAFDFLNDPNQFFDFITLDLKIPIENDSFEKSSKNGLAVLGQCTLMAQGTPLLIFTGTSTVDMITEFLASSHNSDVWAEGRSRSTIDHLPKTKMGEFREKVTGIVNAVLSLSDIELNYYSGSLPIEHDRLIRIFSKNQGGSRAQVTKVGGGLSDAIVYLVHVTNERGDIVHSAIAKCGPMNDISEDALNYDTKINRLRPEVTPRKLQHIKFSAMSNSGVFYGLAAGYDRSFFKSIEEGVITSTIRQCISGMLDRWHETSSQQRVSIKTIRQNLVDDETSELLKEQYGLDWANGFENSKVHANIGCFHCDLHGENILINTASNSATLIDYGDVSEGPITLDPITLECSFLFHPATIKYDWPTKTDIENWENLNKYIEDCPIAEDIRFCREWANSIGAGPRELAACLYSYSLRQLKYKNTNKEIALNLLQASRRIYAES
jgi:CheY-like chemotaxis protein